MPQSVNLNEIAGKVKNWIESVEMKNAPYGTYRFKPGAEPTFYATGDMAIIRWIIGEDLTTLSEEQRSQWADVINSYQNSTDGRYGPEMRHHILHANGTATNALCIIGQQYRYPVRLYELFNTPDRIGPWLTQINWNNPWSASHLVWGGPVLWINSDRATEAWKEACFTWFDQQLNEFGSWPKDFGYTDERSLVPLGCAVHIWPLYRHTGREIPGLERLADHVVDWQKPEGYWDQVGWYGTMDALYVLAVAIEEDLPRTPIYRDALYRYMEPHFLRARASWVTFNAHQVLGWVSCIGYLQRALPDEFTGDIRWGDIFDLKEIYRLDEVMGNG